VYPAGRTAEDDSDVGDPDEAPGLRRRLEARLELLDDAVGDGGDEGVEEASALMRPASCTHTRAHLKHGENGTSATRGRVLPKFSATLVVSTGRRGRFAPADIRTYRTRGERHRRVGAPRLREPSAGRFLEPPGA
jgi:hypothetical protein